MYYKMIPNYISIAKRHSMDLSQIRLITPVDWLGINRMSLEVD